MTSYDYNDTVIVLVGPGKTQFTAHTDVVCARSEFFKAACNKHWQEGQLRVISLPDVDPEAFEMYMDLTYNRLVYDFDSSSLPLVKFYVLADYLDDLEARNKAMRLLLMQRHCPSPETTVFLWEHTLRGSLLRQWAVDLVAAKLGIDKFSRWIGLYPEEFVQQMAVKMYGYAPAVITFPSDGLRVYLEAEVEAEE